MSIQIINSYTQKETTSEWDIASFDKHINDFLDSKLSESLAIKGKWGTGKTFYWNQTLRQRNGKFPRSRYAYVSLFGVNSLEELKNLISVYSLPTSCAGKNINFELINKNGIETIKETVRRAPALFSSIARSVKLMGVDISIPYHVATEYTINNLLICFDDLERIGKGLSVKDFLGYVAWLRDKKECKVILLVNDQESELDDYEKYKEKSLDHELLFSPSANDCAKIALPQDAPWVATVIPLITNLGIKNIRIIKKISQHINKIIAEIDSLLRNEDADFVEEIKNQILVSIPFLTWAHLDATEDAIPLEFIATKHSWIRTNKFNNEPEEKVNSWNERLISYGYLGTDDLNGVLIDFIYSGWLNIADFSKIILSRAEERKQKKLINATDEAWDIFRDSFDSNQDEFIKKMYALTLENINYLSFGNAISSYEILKALNETDKADSLISAFLNSRASTPEIFTNNHFSIPLELEEKINAIRKAKKHTRSPKHILIDINNKSHWGINEEEALAAMSENEYYSLLKNVNKDELHACLKSILLFRNLGNPTENSKKIAAISLGALKRISDESPINRLRLQRWGIKLQD